MFTNKKTVTVADEATFFTTGGQTFTDATGGSRDDDIGGSLDFAKHDLQRRRGLPRLSAGAAGKQLDPESAGRGGRWDVRVPRQRHTDRECGGGQSVVLQSVGCVSRTDVTAPAGFTNAGSIELTNVEGICAESRARSLSWSGTLTNTGTLTSNFGAAGGSRTLNGSLTNSGAVNIDSDTSFEGSSAVFTNKKTVTVADEATLSPPVARRSPTPPAAL